VIGDILQAVWRVHVEMQFLSDVYLRCPDCDGRRYRAEVLK